jgi:hypothetical protein
MLRIRYSPIIPQIEMKFNGRLRQLPPCFSTCGNGGFPWHLPPGQVSQFEDIYGMQQPAKPPFQDEYNCPEWQVWKG